MTTAEPTLPTGEDLTPARLIVRALVDPEPAPIDSGDPLIRQQWDPSIWHRLY